MDDHLSTIPETTTQAPCGFGSSLVTQLLTHWKYEGYIRWLRGLPYTQTNLRSFLMAFIPGLGAQYTARRDQFIDCLEDEFDLQLSCARDGVWAGCDYYLASSKSSAKRMSEKFGRKTMFSFVPPTSGMFVWVRGFIYPLVISHTRLSDQVAP
jgi:aromatic amino acid aminotransferase I